MLCQRPAWPTLSGLACVRRVHVGEVDPDEERLAALRLPFDVVGRSLRDVVVDRFHPLLGQRAGVFDRLFADAAEARVDGGVIAVGGFAIQHAARSVLGAELGVLRIVGQLRLLFRVEVIQVAVEFVEAVHRRQEFVAVAEVVLADLRGGVSALFEQRGDRGVFLLQSERRAGQADFGQSGPQAMLPGDEGGPARRATLLGVVVGEDHALLCKTVDVRRPVAHQTHRIGADVRLADVVTPDDDDVRPLVLRRRRRGQRKDACE